MRVCAFAARLCFRRACVSCAGHCAVSARRYARALCEQARPTLRSCSVSHDAALRCARAAAAPHNMLCEQDKSTERNTRACAAD
eukprot:783690-Rhodomonas_salina.1